MPFYAIVEALSGDIIDVVESYDDGDMPAGAIAIELPAKEDDIRRWLALHRTDRGGGGVGEAFVEADEATDSGKHRDRRDELTSSEAFFARLNAELVRCELEGRHLGVMLFDLAPSDRPLAQEFVLDALARHGQEMLPCDLLSRLRDHLVGVLMPDTDSAQISVQVPRGSVLALTFPADREQIELIRRRRHPLLRGKASSTRG